MYSSNVHNICHSCEAGEYFKLQIKHTLIQQISIPVISSYYPTRKEQLTYLLLEILAGSPHTINTHTQDRTILCMCIYCIRRTILGMCVYCIRRTILCMCVYCIRRTILCKCVYYIRRTILGMCVYCIRR